MITTEEGLSICRMIETLIKPLRAHCALTGSLLYRGDSEKDANVIIYSHDAVNDPYDKQEILNALSPILQQPPYQTSANYFNKDVVILEIAGTEPTRVDLFFFP